jgi:hypothetical protein
MQFDTVLERTEAGIHEVHQKTNRLTQSERLVLIMADGRADIATLIEKLPSLSMPRVFRAIDKLQELGLMTTQLIAPVGSGNANDAIAPEVVERFLQQTDLDPATIIRNDPKEFDPTTISHAMLLRDPITPRVDSELELRLKALMGETPRFAQADTSSAISIVTSEAKQQSTAVTTSVVRPARTPVPLAARQQPLLPEVRPEEVVRAAHHAGSTSSTVSVSKSITGAQSRPLKQKSRQEASLTTEHKIPASLRPAAAPPEKSNLGLYLVMGGGLLLVLFTLLRPFFK